MFDQPRADSVRAAAVLRSVATPVPVATVGQQAGLSVARAEAALAYLASQDQATADTDGLWRPL